MEKLFWRAGIKSTLGVVGNCYKCESCGQQTVLPHSTITQSFRLIGLQWFKRIWKFSPWISLLVRLRTTSGQLSDCVKYFVFHAPGLVRRGLRRSESRRHTDVSLQHLLPPRTTASLLRAEASEQTWNTWCGNCFGAKCQHQFVRAVLEP